jgi:hypothetical protein
MSGSRKHLLAVGAVAALALAACSDLTTTRVNSLAFASAFATVPAGFSFNSNTFDATGDNGMPFFPGALAPMGASDRGPGSDHGGRGPGDHGDHRDGFGPDGLLGMLMGGGLGPDFIGGIPFGKGRGRGPFGRFDLPASCTFDATSGRVTCPEKTGRGDTVNVSFAFKDKDGTAQAKFDTSTTNSVNVQTTVAGSRMRKDSSVTTLSHSSDRTVTGLAAGSTERTVNGSAKAHESSTGKRDSVTFTVVRDAGDTTTNVVIPIVDGKPTIPSSGSVIRAMSVTITPQGGATTTKTRREVVTFDGSNVVKVVVTQDGETKNCTITLPGRKLVCE